MTEGNNEFKGFVKSKIKTLEDVAERNYDEHKALYETLTEVRTAVGRLEERVNAIAESRNAKIAFWATVSGAFIMAAAALLRSFL